MRALSKACTTMLGCTKCAAPVPVRKLITAGCAMQKQSPVEVPDLSTAPKTSAGAAELYDKWSDTYDTALKSWEYPAPSRVAKTVEAALAAKQKKSGEGDGDWIPFKVLDLGCGTGLSGEAIRSTFGQAVTLSGVDISAKSLAHLQATKPGLYDSVHFGNLEERLDIVPSNEFDVVISVGVLSYVENFAGIISEALRVCCPGGLIVFTHRSNLWDSNERGCKTAIEDLADAKRLCIKSIGSPEPYMPKNPTPSERIKTIRIVVCERT